MKKSSGIILPPAGQGWAGMGRAGKGCAGMDRDGIKWKRMDRPGQGWMSGWRRDRWTDRNGWAGMDGQGWMDRDR